MHNSNKNNNRNKSNKKTASGKQVPRERWGVLIISEPFGVEYTL